MSKPTPIELLTAEKLRADRGVETMRSALDAAAANTARADALEQTARNDLAVAEGERATHRAQLGGELAVRIVKGLPDEPIPTHTEADAKVVAATTHLSICSIAAAQLREIHVAAIKGLRAAENTAREAAKAVRDAENDERAADIREILKVLRQKQSELRANVDMGIGTPLNMPLHPLSPAVEEALALNIGFDAINTPVFKLRAMMLEGKDI